MSQELTRVSLGIGGGEVTVKTPTFSVEVIMLPVSDVDRALRFYVDQVGWTPGKA